MDGTSKSGRTRDEPDRSALRQSLSFFSAYAQLHMQKLLLNGQNQQNKDREKEKKQLYVLERKSMKKHSRILLELLCSGCMALGSVTTAFVPVFAVEETDPGQTADIPEALPDLSKITLTVDSQGESWGNGNGADKAIDGNFDTIFDGLKNSYMVFDLGGEKTIAGIGYCPRTNAGNNNYAARTQGGVIAGSNDKETWTDLYTIPEVPAQNKITQVRSSSFNEGTASSYRYIKYYKNESGNNADADYVNIAEFEVYEPGSHFTLSSVGAIKDNQLHMPATVKANGVNRTVTWTMPEIEGSLPLSAVEVTGILDAQGDLPEAQITGKAWIYPSDLEYLINGNAGENDPLWQQAKTLYPELLNADAADQGWEEGKSWGVVGEKTTSNESNTGDYGVTGNQESLSPYDYGWWAGTKTDDSKVLKIKLTLPAGKHTIKVGTHGNWWNSDSTRGQKAYWILDDGTEYEIGDCSITERNAQAFSFDIDLNTQQTGTLAFKKTGEKEPTIAWVTVSGKYEGVDRSALNTLYDTVKDYAAADFSEESWAGFEDARSAAATALKTPLPTTEGVSTALANLQKETDELRHLYTLVFKNGDEVFKTVENAVEKEPLSTYIPSETPTADGQIFIGWGIAEDEVVSGSRLEFVAQYKGDTTELDNEYKECLQITNDGNTYSQESFDAFTAARDAAKAVLDKEAPSAAEVTEALTALQAARQALVELVTVTFNTQDGSTIELVTVEKNTVVARPAENPTKAGFTFKGWYTTADGDEEFDFDTPITQSTTIYAQWTEIPTPKYTVTFDTQGGSTVEAVEVEKNGKVSRPATNPTKTGFTFKGWYTSADGTEEFNFETPITQTTTIYAKWEAVNKDALNQMIELAKDVLKRSLMSSEDKETLQANADAQTEIAKAAESTQEQVNAALNSLKNVLQGTDATGVVITGVSGVAEGSTPCASQAQEGDVTIAKTLDGNTGTFYHSAYNMSNMEVKDRNLLYDLGESKDLFAISFLPRQHTAPVNGDFLKVEVYVGDTSDPEQMTLAGTYEFDYETEGTKKYYATSSRSEYRNMYFKPVNARYVNLVVKEAGGNNQPVSTTITVAEVKFFSPSDKDALKTAIETADSKAEAEYTAESWVAMQTALTAANAVLNNPAAYQNGEEADIVDKAAKALNDAINNLVKKYIVTFNTQGGSTVESVDVAENGKVTRPATAPTKAGFDFKGWYTTADGDDEFNFDTPITQTTTIYAQWTEKQTAVYTVTFDTQGGTPVESVNVEENGKVTRPANDPQKTGYTFAGWFAEGSEKVFDFSTPITGDLKLKARWTVESYVVTFDSDGGTPVASMTTDYGTAITAPSNPTKTGYTFAGWFVGGAEKAFDFNTKITGPLTLTAHWTANKYTVSFDSDGGSAVSPVTVEFNHPISKPADPTKTGCIFDGWFAEGSKTAFDFSTPITGDLKLVAHWMNRILTVLFVVDGVSDFAIPVINGNSVARPDDPVRKGYRFAGWYADEARETPYDFTTKVTKPIRIYANWEKGPDYTLLDMAATKAVQIERSLQSYRSIIGTDGKDVKTVFAEAKAAAEAVRNSSTATQEDVDNAAKALNNAMLALRKAPSKEVLDQLSA